MKLLRTIIDKDCKLRIFTAKDPEGLRVLRHTASHVLAEAVKVLDTIAKKYGHKFTYKNVIAGGCAIDQFGNPLPKEQLDICLNSDSVLLGAVGGPKWDDVDPSIRPEKALLGLRGGMKVYANLRPALMFPQLKAACPLKDEIVGDGLDILIVRELTGGIYFGDRGISEDGRSAFDTERYSWEEASLAFCPAAAETSASCRTNSSSFFAIS